MWTCSDTNRKSVTAPVVSCMLSLDGLEKAMAPHSSTLAWKIPWMEEPSGLQLIESLRVGHDWATSLSFFTFMHWRRRWQPTPVLLPGESQGQGAWWAAVYGVAQSQTLLKQLSSSSSSTVSAIQGVPQLWIQPTLDWIYSEKKNTQEERKSWICWARATIHIAFTLYL